MRPKRASAVTKHVAVLAWLIEFGGSFSCLHASATIVTYSRDIAPIFFKHCAECHRPGDIAPFSVLTFTDTRPWAKAILRAVVQGTMPPWKPEVNYGHFKNERRLSQREITTIREWVEAGSPEGDPAELPPRPKFPDGWVLGKPDLVLSMPESFTVPAKGGDVFQAFVIPINIQGTKYVRGFEFRPGNRRVLHHSVAYLDGSGVARRKDREDPDVGYRSFGDPGFTPSGALGGWSPGARGVMLPDGVAQPIHRGEDLVIQNHYHPTGEPESDRSAVGLYLTSTPPEKIAVSFPLLQQKLSIPPNDSHFLATASIALPIAATVISVTPHMHFLGREVQVRAVTPDNTTVPMIWIKNWSYFWHSQYFYTQPLSLPRNTRIQMSMYFDNSAANALNPNQPPRRVRWGSETNDEMALCFVQLAIERIDELPRLWGAIMNQPGLRRGQEE